MSGYTSFNVVLLAAGLSQRMGAENKLLLSIDGEPLVRRSVNLYSNLGMNVTVVLGHESDRIKSALSGLAIKTILNPNYESGQQSSVKIGLESYRSSDAAATLIALSDQPLLTSSDIVAYCDAFLESARDKIMVPYWGQSRGNPVMFPNGIIEQVRAEGRTPACRKFIDTNPHLVTRYTAPNSHFVNDIDTPKDAERLLPLA